MYREKSLSKILYGTFIKLFSLLVLQWPNGTYLEHVRNNSHKTMKRGKGKETKNVKGEELEEEEDEIQVGVKV